MTYLKWAETFVLSSAILRQREKITLLASEKSHRIFLFSFQQGNFTNKALTVCITHPLLARYSTAYRS